ncbi:hypothetical protein [Endozoicomonas sp. 8E]|uniref:hypothetical protein n=1 Tax=Endozoicomonas sp. 8E TaxID=3035692 RepID=UPI002939466D|nr:hypothetical protein [Endozoicomonas sp. 8E]WOG29587.1 hypothetical protein P6910_08025 [Endozoicomonas sp. 8E]
MTSARPNVLNLAVAVAISSSIITSQALGDRRLLVKSVDILDSVHVEFTQSEVMVQPTLGDDRQPIPKSFTTTYTDLTQTRAGYEVPSEGFTDVLSGIEGGVSSVDLFETDENDVARKYTKVLKVGNEGVFRFTHNLAKKELVIEVRNEMTDQKLIAAILTQSGDTQALEPLTKVASPELLNAVLKGVSGSIENLGAVDNYVALATIEVDEVKVNGRTFMRPIAAGDQPPDLQRLGQSLFVNDEALFAAATSAYTQVHLLGKDLQQGALNDLLSCHKPIGYVVHIEDDTQAYPVPAGYPKLEVKQAPGEAIVFHGQKQNPTDIAFVESLYKLLEKDFNDNSIPPATTQVEKDKVRSYQYVIRSRQMALLEEIAVQLNSESGRAKLITLAYYESLQQALTSATPEKADKFEFTSGHIRLASSMATPTWMHSQLVKHFGFKPAIKNFLTSQLFIQTIQEVTTILSRLNEVQADVFEDNRRFAFKVTSDIARQLTKIESELEEQQQVKEVRLIQLEKELMLIKNRLSDDVKSKVRLLQRRKQVEDEFVQVRNLMRELQKQSQKLQQEVRGIPKLEQRVRDTRVDIAAVRANAKKAFNAELADDLGIDDWDDSKPLKEQVRLIRKKIDEVFSSVALMERPVGDSTEEILAALELRLGIFLVNEKDPAVHFRFIQRHLQKQAEQNLEVFLEKVGIVERVLGLAPKNNDDLIARQYAIDKAIQQCLEQSTVLVGQEHPFLQQSTRTDAKKEAEIKAFNAATARHLNIKDFDNNADIDLQEQQLLHRFKSLSAALKRLDEMNVEQDQLLNRFQSTNAAIDEDLERLLWSIRKPDAKYSSQEDDVKVKQDTVAKDLPVPKDEESTIEQDDTLIEGTHDRSSSPANSKEKLDDTGRPPPSIVRPEVIRELRALKIALQKRLSEETDLYFHSMFISEDIKKYIREARKQSEKEALVILENLESLFNIKINEGDDKAVRLQRLRTRLDGGDITPYELDEMDKILFWEADSIAQEDPAERDIRLSRFRERLTFKVEESHQRAREKQAEYLTTVEDELNIDPHENPATKERGRTLTTKLASILEVKFVAGASLSDNKYDLRHRIKVVRKKINTVVEDRDGAEVIKRVYNNRIAHRLNIEDYQDDATIADQNSLIDAKLQQIDKEVIVADQPDIDERIAAIEDELDRRMAPQGSKPRFVLDRRVAMARRGLEEAESELANINRKLNAIGHKQVVFVSRDDIEPISDEDDRALNQAMKQIQTELGLPAGDEQTPEERVDDIRHFMGEQGADRRDEIVEKLGAVAKALNIRIKGGPGSPQKADYIIAISASAKAHGWDEINAADEALGELPLTRKKYSQAKEFLHEHDRKAKDAAFTLLQKMSAQENLDLKKEEINRSGDADQKAKTGLDNKMALPKTAVEQKSDTESETLKTPEANEAEIKATENAQSPEPDFTEIRKRVNALRNKPQVREFLDKHDRKSMDAALAEFQKSIALKNPDRSREETENEIEPLNAALKKKSDAAAKALEVLEAHEADIKTTEEAVGLEPGTSDIRKRVNALRIKRVELGGNDGHGCKIQQLVQEQARLTFEREVWKADIKKMKENLKTAQGAVENYRAPFQHTPRQVKVLDAILEFMQQHPLKKQALEAAFGLTEAAIEYGTPFLTTFHFDDEFAPIRLQALVGDRLTFEQASQIVEVFRILQRDFPVSLYKPLENQPVDALEELEYLVFRARNEMETGAQHYDDVIKRIGSTGIQHFGHETENLKGFSEYFASHSASGNKIIALLREGLISKVELENYMKISRSIDGYLTRNEFEHFIGCRQGVNVHQFKRVVWMLSDKGVEEFMKSAFTPVPTIATGPVAMKESVAGMKEYAAAVIANYILDDIAFENGRRTAAYLANIQDTLTPYVNAAGISESELIKAIHDKLMEAHATAVERQLKDYWLKPSASLVQAVPWYYTSYKPLLAMTGAWKAAKASLLNTVGLYIMDLTNRGDYTHRMIIPFQHWLEHYGIDLDRTGQYAYHSGVEKVSEVLGLYMPYGRASSSVILLITGTTLFTRQYHANPHLYRSISRLVPEIVKSMGSRQGVQVPLLHRVTPQTVKTLASATAGLVLGPVSTVGAYAHGLIFGFNIAQMLGFALASSLTFDFFMNDNKLLTQWLGGPLGRSLDKINRWRGAGEKDDEYLQRTAIASPQRFTETDEEYANRVKANNTMYGWTRHENYLQFRERRDRTMKLFENGWEKYFRENVPKWSFSHANSIPYSYTLGTFYNWQQGDDKKAPVNVMSSGANRKSGISGKVLLN